MAPSRCTSSKINKTRSNKKLQQWPASLKWQAIGMRRTGASFRNISVELKMPVMTVSDTWKTPGPSEHKEGDDLARLHSEDR
jgi:hypothetical protein